MARVIPNNFQDPVGLAGRLVRSREPAAYFAIGSAAAAALAAPFDVALAALERRRYARAPRPSLPIVVVVGAPRSGTTIVAQVLLNALPVGYFNNLTSVFPRAPIVANRLLGRWVRGPREAYRSFYGRTSGLGGPNDGLYLWDRWLGEDRYAPPSRLAPEVREEMARFFGAFEQATGRPLVTKNNALATQATAVAEALPTARFIAVRRKAPYVVQSILRARETIQGDRKRPYGVGAPGAANGSPIEEVCAQVLYHERRYREQEAALGADRFWVVDYEDVCRDPRGLLGRVAREILGTEIDPRSPVPELHAANRVACDPGEFAEIEATLARLASEREARS